MALLCWPASGSLEQEGRSRHTHTKSLHDDDARDDDNAVMVMVMRTTVSGILGRRRWTEWGGVVGSEDCREGSCLGRGMAWRGGRQTGSISSR